MQQHLEPRRRSSGDIKLLRLDLLGQSNSPCSDIGVDWSPAQPVENLSPEKASKALNIEIWVPQSVVKQKYKILQFRYPPEQFAERHLDWRPSADLLANPCARLNWYWQSGLIPLFTSYIPYDKNLLWDANSALNNIDAKIALKRFIESL